MIKTVFITHQTNFYGAPRCLFNLISRFDKEKIDILLVCPSDDSKFINAFKNIGVKVVSIRKFPPNQSPIMLKLWYRISYIIKLILFLRDKKPDVIYLNTIINSGAALGAWILRIPVITHVHESAYFFEKVGWLRKFIILKLSRFFITVSNANQELLANFGIKPEKIAVVYNGIDTKYFSEDYIPTNYPSYSDNYDLMIGYFGSIEHHKGLHILIEAAKQLKSKYNLHYVILGDVPAGCNIGYLNEIKETINEYGLEKNFIFESFKEDIRPYLMACNIICIPSLTESFPLIAVESMAMGRTVIAPRTGGLAELIGKDRGLLFTPGDVEQLASAIINLCNNKHFMVECSKRGREWVRKHLTLESCAKAIQDIIEGVHKGKDKSL